MAADNSDSTMVRGLVIQGHLSTEVRGLVITPARLCLKPHSPPDPDVPAPKLVSSFPANGSVVKPGIIVLRLTFDLPMACAALLEPALLTTNPCPAPLVDPVISKDRRTFMTVCAVQPNTRYGVWLNSDSNPAPVFGDQLMSSVDRAHPPRWTNLAGHQLASRQIVFSTSGADKVSTLRDAIAEDRVLLAMMRQGQDAAASSQPSGPAAQSGR